MSFASCAGRTPGRAIRSAASRNIRPRELFINPWSFRLTEASLHLQGRLERRVSFRHEADDFVFLRVAVDADGLRAAFDRADLVPEELSEHEDAPVRFAEVLPGAVGHRPLGLPRHVVLAGY